MVDADSASVDGTDPAPVVACIAGPSDAGKTSLVESLVPRLAERHRVATVKSIHHDIEPDEPGTDTHRHREAGADAAVGVTPSYTFEVTPGGKSGHGGDSDAASERAALARVLDRLAARGHDVILVEGFSSVALPTIVVGERRDDVRGEIIATDDDPVAVIAERIEKLDPVSSVLE